MQLQVENLIGGYGKKEILHNISFNINEGDVLCILGPNGCGKSTLLKLLLRIITKMTGNVFIHGKNTDKIDRKTLAQIFSYMPQSDRMLFPYTILEMVTMGRTCHIGKWNTPSKDDINIAYEALEKLKIAHMANKLYTNISGGERQLVLIARAICQDASILIMDEPTSSLDFANKLLVMDAISTAVKEGRSVILTTHSPSEPFSIASKVLLLSNGRKVGFGKPLEVLTSKALERVYGIPMDIMTVTDRFNDEMNICMPIHK